MTQYWLSKIWKGELTFALMIFIQGQFSVLHHQNFHYSEVLQGTPKTAKITKNFAK